MKWARIFCNIGISPAERLAVNLQNYARPWAANTTLRLERHAVSTFPIV